MTSIIKLTDYEMALKQAYGNFIYQFDREFIGEDKYDEETGIENCIRGYGGELAFLRWLSEHQVGAKYILNLVNQKSLLVFGISDFYIYKTRWHVGVRTVKQSSIYDNSILYPAKYGKSANIVVFLKSFSEGYEFLGWLTMAEIERMPLAEDSRLPKKGARRVPLEKLRTEDELLSKIAPPQKVMPKKPRSYSDDATIAKYM